jgi:hypothetical protein
LRQPIQDVLSQGSRLLCGRHQAWGAGHYKHSCLLRRLVIFLSPRRVHHIHICPFSIIIPSPHLLTADCCCCCCCCPLPLPSALCPLPSTSRPPPNLKPRLGPVESLMYSHSCVSTLALTTQVERDIERSTPNNALQHATGKIGGYTREPEVRSTREHHRLPPAYGRYSRRTYRAHELFLFAYRKR